MARQPLRLTRGTAAQIAAYTGGLAEPILNIETKAIHVQDGQTPGGVPTRMGRVPSSAELSAGTAIDAIPSLADVPKVGVRHQRGNRPRSYQDRFNDAPLCVFEFMPDAVIAAILAGTNTTDVTAYVNAALATGRDVVCPGPTVSGTQALYPISGKLVFVRNGQRLTGAGRIDSVFIASAPPPPAAPPSFSSYFELFPFCELVDVGIRFDQSAARETLLPSTYSVSAVDAARAKLVRYPPAIDVANAQRARLRRVQISGAWDGINGQGNAGGLVLEDVEIGAFNQYLNLDGLRDFPHVRGLHLYPFGISDFYGSPTLTAIHAAYPPAMVTGSCDGLRMEVSVFQGRVVFNETVHGGAFGTMPSLNLDGSASRIEMLGRCSISVGALYKTTASPTDFCILASGGARLNIATVDISVPDDGSNIVAVTGPMVRSTGAGTVVTIGGGTTYAAYEGAVMGQADAGGALVIGGVRSLGYSGKVRTDPVWKEVNGGILVVNGATSCPVEAGASTGGGPFILLSTDHRQQHVQGNNSGGYRIDAPANANLGCYGPNKCPKTPFVPSITFQTPGDYNPAYSVRQGFYWYTGSGIEFELRLAGTSNAYATPSGLARISGVPVKTQLDSRPVLLGECSGLQLPANRSAFGAVLSAGDGGAYLIATGSGVATSYLDRNAFPVSQGFGLSMTGFVPTL